MIEKRGRLDDADIHRFVAAGFGTDHPLEVTAAVAAATIANNAGSITSLSKRLLRNTLGSVGTPDCDNSSDRSR